MSFEAFLDRTLSEKKAQNRYRARYTVRKEEGVLTYLEGVTQPLINFCSNDYLGLKQHPNSVMAAKSALDELGTGSGASHLVCGHSHYHHACEERIASITGREAALLFSTGYMANMGVINALLTKHDEIFQDKLNHASLIDAAQLSRATFTRYKHNDMAHLEAKLCASQAQKKLVVVDGVFSMDGNVANLPALTQLCQRYNAWLMVDDAHGFGVLGKQGAGVLSEYNISQQDAPILMGTLGKAAGSFGAFIAGSQALIDTLIQLSRSYIYTTALPPSVAAASHANMALFSEEPQRQSHLHALITLFKAQCAKSNITLLPSSTAIQPLIVGDEKRTMALAAYLHKAGFWVGAIRPPTVPVGTSRLRITLSAAHSFEQVNALIAALVAGLNSQS